MQTRTLHAPRRNTTCAMVISLAKARNSRALMQLSRQGIALDETDQDRDAVSYLAEAGDFNSAMYLIERFGFSHDSAVFGAAVINNTEKIAQFLTADNRHVAAWGFALGGWINRVNAELPDLDRNQVDKVVYYYELNGQSQAGIDYLYRLIGEFALRWRISIETVRRNLDGSIYDAAIDKGDYARAQVYKKEEYFPILPDIHARAGHVNEVIDNLDAYKPSLVRELVHENTASIIGQWYGHLIYTAAGSSDVLVFQMLRRHCFSLDSFSVITLLRAGRYGLAAALLPLLPKVLLYKHIMELKSKEAAGYPLDEDLHYGDPDVGRWVASKRIAEAQAYIDGKFALDFALSDEPLKAVSAAVLAQAEKEAEKEFYESLELIILNSFGLGKAQFVNFLLDNMLDNKLIHALSQRSLKVGSLPLRRPWLIELAMINKPEYRLAYFIQHNLKDRKMLHYAGKINYLMRTYFLDCIQAAYLSKAGRAPINWLVAALPLNNGQVNNLFWQIAKNLLCVNKNDARAIYLGIVQHILHHQPEGMRLQAKLGVFGLFKPATTAPVLTLSSSKDVPRQG